MADPARPPVTGYPAPTHSSSAYYAHSGAAAANGYPYPAAVAPPPQQNYAYAYHYDPASVAASRAAFLRRMIAVMIAFFVVSASVIFIIWLVLRPRLPKFSVDAVAVSNLNLTSPVPPAKSAMSGDWSVGFSVYNPNKKMSIAFDDISAELVYHSAFLSETRVPPFEQDTKDRTTVNATFSAKNSYVENWVVSDINGDRGKGTVSFDFRIWARVGFRSGGWRLRRRLLRVHCENVGVKMSTGSGSGKLIGGPRECRVGV